MRTKHVVVLPYNEKWKQDFIDIKTELSQALGEIAISIEHVGSAKKLWNIVAAPFKPEAHHLNEEETVLSFNVMEVE